MQVTPGYTFAGNEEVTLAKLNLAAKPVVALESGDVTGDALNIPEVVAAIGEGATGPNYWFNGAFRNDRWQRGTSAVTCTAGALTERADWWWCRPGAGSCTYQQAGAGPDVRALNTALLTGSSSCLGVVDFGQDILSCRASALQKKLTVSFQLQNNTGVSITPNVVIDVPSTTLDTYTSVTNVANQPCAAAAPNGQWTACVCTLDATSLDFSRGARVYIRLPSACLNASGKTVTFAEMKIEPGGSATPFAVEREDSPEASAATGTMNPAESFLDNGNFARWIAPSLTLVSATEAGAAESWTVLAGGANGVVAARVTPSMPAGALSNVALSLTGATSVSTVDLMQQLAPGRAALAARQLVFSAWIFNNTGADFVPELRLDTCNASGAFGAVTNQVDTTLTNCPNGAWQRVNYAFSGAGITNWLNGARLAVRIPNGVLASGAAVVLIAQAKLEAGLAPSGVWDVEPEFASPFVAAPSGTASGLVIDYTAGSGNISIYAREMVLRRLDGAPLIVRGQGSTFRLTNGLALSNSGANGLDTGAPANTTAYYLFVISDGTNVAGLFSLSASTPVLPGAYRYYALVGAVVTNGSAALAPFLTIADWTYIQTFAVVTAGAPSGGANTFSTLSLVACVPPLATAVRGVIATEANASLGVSVRQTSSIGDIAEQVLAGAANTTSTGGLFASQSFEVPLNPYNQFAPSFDWLSSSATSNKNLNITAFRLG